MSDRKNAIRKHIEERHAAAWAILSRLGPDDWGRPVYSTESAHWSARDVLAHLADAERGQAAQMKRILAGGHSLPPDFDLDRWNRRSVERRTAQSGPELLADIAASYADLLALLDAIPEADLDKTGRHPRGDDLSLEGYFRRISDHRATHAAETAQALAGGR